MKGSKHETYQGEPGRMIIGQNLMLVRWEKISWLELANSEVAVVKMRMNNGYFRKQKTH